MERRQKININIFFDVPLIPEYKLTSPDNVMDELDKYGSLYEENRRINHELDRSKDIIDLMSDIKNESEAIKGMYYGIRMYNDLRENFLRLTVMKLIEKANTTIDADDWDRLFEIARIQSNTIDAQRGIDGILGELLSTLEENNAYDKYSVEAITYVSRSSDGDIKRLFEEYISPFGWQMIEDLDPSIFFEFEDIDIVPNISTKQKLENLLATLRGREKILF